MKREERIALLVQEEANLVAKSTPKPLFQQREANEIGRDTADIAQADQEEKARISSLTAGNPLRLSLVRKALALFKNEEWDGSCCDRLDNECEGEIADARIRAVPWTTNCFTCANKQDPDRIGIIQKRENRCGTKPKDENQTIRSRRAAL